MRAQSKIVINIPILFKVFLIFIIEIDQNRQAEIKLYHETMTEIQNTVDERPSRK